MMPSIADQLGSGKNHHRLIRVIDAERIQTIERQIVGIGASGIVKARRTSCSRWVMAGALHGPARCDPLVSGFIAGRSGSRDAGRRMLAYSWQHAARLWRYAVPR